MIDRNHTRAELLRLGFDDDAISKAIEDGDLDRIGTGLFGPANDQALPREQAHRERALLAARQARDRGFTRARALADVSAAAVLGMPLWGLPTQKVVAFDFTRPPGTRESRTARLVTDRRTPALVDVDGVALAVSAPARTVIDIARRHSRIPAIAAGDYALHNGLCTVDDLREELDLACGMTGINRARAYVAEMDPLSESVLESRSRIKIIDLDLPVPVRQHVIVDDAGVFVARVDFYWPDYGLVGEADGDVKYRSDPQAVLREKWRTDRLHELGYRVVRWDWRTVNNPDLLRARIVAMMTARRPPTSIARIDLAS